MAGLATKKIQRYNNSPPYVMARWPPQQIPPLNFLGLYSFESNFLALLNPIMTMIESLDFKFLEKSWRVVCTQRAYRKGESSLWLKACFLISYTGCSKNVQNLNFFLLSVGLQYVVHFPKGIRLKSFRYEMGAIFT